MSYVFSASSVEKQEEEHQSHKFIPVVYLTHLGKTLEQPEMTTVFHARPYGRFMEIFIIIISLFIADKIVKYW